MNKILTRHGLMVLTGAEYRAALHRGKTVTANRPIRRAKLAFRVAGALTCLPYSDRLSRWVDRLIVVAEASR